MFIATASANQSQLRRSLIEQVIHFAPPTELALVLLAISIDIQSLRDFVQFVSLCQEEQMFGSAGLIHDSRPDTLRLF
jgi:hypothetical protein